MECNIPVRLGKEPLLEAIWEIRFTDIKLPIADILPGLLFKENPTKYNKIERLFIADIPPLLVKQNPNMKYLPKLRLDYENTSVQIGDCVISYSCRKPYLGWERFSNEIDLLIKIIRGTDIIGNLERFSLKYIDLLEFNEPPNLNCLNLDLRVGEVENKSLPVNLRMEIPGENLVVHIVEIVSPAELTLRGDIEKKIGVLIQIDTIVSLDKDKSWDYMKENLDKIHLSCKKMFFQLLKEETIDKLEPIYEG